MGTGKDQADKDQAACPPLGHLALPQSSIYLTVSLPGAIWLPNDSRGGQEGLTQGSWEPVGCVQPRTRLLFPLELNA